MSSCVSVSIINPFSRGRCRRAAGLPPTADFCEQEGGYFGIDRVSREAPQLGDQQTIVRASEMLSRIYQVMLLVQVKQCDDAGSVTCCDRNRSRPRAAVSTSRRRIAPEPIRSAPA